MLDNTEMATTFNALTPAHISAASRRDVFRALRTNNCIHLHAARRYSNEIDIVSWNWTSCWAASASGLYGCDSHGYVNGSPIVATIRQTMKYDMVSSFICWSASCALCRSSAHIFSFECIACPRHCWRTQKWLRFTFVAVYRVRFRARAHTYTQRHGTHTDVSTTN